MLISIDIHMQWILNLQKPKNDQVLILPIMIERRNFERKKYFFLVSYVTVRYFFDAKVLLCLNIRHLTNTVVDSVVDSLSVDLWVLGVGVGVVVPGIRFGF